MISNETVLSHITKTCICWKTECEHVQIKRPLINSVSNLSVCLQTNGYQRQARVYSRVYLASYGTYLCTVTALFHSNRSINDYFIVCGSLKFPKYKSAICAGRGFKFMNKYKTMMWIAFNWSHKWLLDFEITMSITVHGTSPSSHTDLLDTVTRSTRSVSHTPPWNATRPCLYPNSRLSSERVESRSWSRRSGRTAY